MAENEWSLFASLAEPQRRDLYTYVRAQHRPVTREEAARACDMSRSLAAFHLEKLVEVGLLTATTESQGVGLRGRGRPPKSYQASETELRLVLPERRLDLLGDILVDAVAARPQDAWQDAIDAGRRHGEQVGRRYRPRRRGARHGRAALNRALADVGAEPRAENEGRVVLANCPFWPLAERRPDLVCSIYRAFCDGLIDGIGASAHTVADPAPGRCCIGIRH